MDEPAAVEPLLLGPYELIERIASGGMAEVYVARRQGPHGFNKTVAVKRILPQLAQDPEFVAMFVDEARVVSTMTHPNIVQVFDFGEHEGELYMAMEYVRGTNVARLVRAAVARGKVIPLDVCLHIVLSVLHGLEHAHEALDESGVPLKLVHRDVSPGNVLIAESGAVKLTDFGIARANIFERRTAVGHLKGKLGYMSPEQVSGYELDARSDLFTLGIILAELLTLKPLFAGAADLEVLMRIGDADVAHLADEALPDDVNAVLMLALARIPDQRYPSARAFAEDVEALARRRGLSLGASSLVAWLADLDNEPAAASDTRDGATEKDVRDMAAPTDNRPWEDERVTPPLATYRMQLADGSTLGPLAYHEVAELFATGSVAPGCDVARDDGPFGNPTTLPELARFVSDARRSADGGRAPAAGRQRALGRAWLPGWLFRLALTRRTGAIQLRDGARRKTAYLVDGRPEFASSTEKRELLGEYLVAQGRLTRADVEMALSILPRFGGRIGDAFVGLGLLRPVELVRAIHEQTIARYLEILRWQKGMIAFEASVVSGEETFPLEVDPLSLVAQGVREGFATDEILGWLRECDGSLLSPVANPPFRRESLRWTVGEDEAFAGFIASRSLVDVLDELTTYDLSRRDDGIRALFFGLSFGLLTSEGFEIPDPELGTTE